MKTYDDALNKLAEKVDDLEKKLLQTGNQRRNQVLDLYGVEHYALGDKNTPATTYISISPDMLYLERMEFKIIIHPFAMPVGDGGRTSDETVNVKPTNLTVNGNNVSPNPHKHETDTHHHSLKAGITLFPPYKGAYRVFIEGIDITTALKKQFKTAWINGEGVFPISENRLANYDILKACEDLYPWQQGVILSAGYKKVEIKGEGAFAVTLVDYLKYSHTNR